MNRIFFSIRKVVFSLAFAGLMVTAAVPVYANKNKDNVNPVAGNQPAVNFVGADNAASVFHVSFNNEKQEKFELVVREANGDVLYRNIFETGKFSKYIKLLNEGDGAEAKLSFIIRILPNGEVHTFDVNSNVKLVKDVIVTKQ